jgi:phosphate transport system protein
MSRDGSGKELREDMRTDFHEQLQELEDETLSTLELTSGALDQAIEAVLNADDELAVMVINNDDRIDGRYLDVNQGVLNLIALQAPVASDLRLVAAVLHTIRHVERIGDLSVNIAKMVPLMGDPPAGAQDIIAKLEAAGNQARDQIRQAGVAFKQRNLNLAENLVSQDEVIDGLNRQIFREAVELGSSDDHAREWGAHAMLIARYIERIGDNTVDIGEQIAFVVSGEFREFTDASHPGGLATSENH